jgi:hypothetical protein
VTCMLSCTCTLTSSGALHGGALAVCTLPLPPVFGLLPLHRQASVASDNRQDGHTSVTGSPSAAVLICCLGSLTLSVTGALGTHMPFDMQLLAADCAGSDNIRRRFTTSSSCRRCCAPSDP